MNYREITASLKSDFYKTLHSIMESPERQKFFNFKPPCITTEQRSLKRNNPIKNQTNKHALNLLHKPQNLTTIKHNLEIQQKLK